MSKFEFEAIGTHWQIDIYETLSPEKEADVLTQIKQRIDVFDKNYSRFRADSLVTEMSERAGEYVLPDDAEAMMGIYEKLFVLTGGLLTPLIGQVMVDSGYDAKYSLQQSRELEKPPLWDDVLSYTHPRLEVKKPVLLDFGAAGKGYLIDLVGEVLEQNDITDFCIDAGGDILHKHTEETPMYVLRVGLENPEDFSQVIGVCNLSNKSLCASAGSRRKWQNFHHIINPETLKSPQEILGTWVVAGSTLVADAIATSLFFVSPQTLTPHYNFEYVILYSDHSVLQSSNFPGELFNI